MLIVLTGKKGSGKDFIGSELSKQLNLPTFAYARAVKEHLSQLLGWDIQLFHRRETKETSLYSQFISYSHLDKILELTDNKGEEEFFLDVFKDNICYSNHEGFQLHISPRKACQKYGTDYARVLNNLEWINRAPKSDCIILDGRFRNEVESAKANGAICVEVIDPNLESDDSHESEAGVPSELVDIVYYNNKTSLVNPEVNVKVLVDKILAVNYNKNLSMIAGAEEQDTRSMFS